MTIETKDKPTRRIIILEFYTHTGAICTLQDSTLYSGAELLLQSVAPENRVEFIQRLTKRAAELHKAEGR